MRLAVVVSGFSLLLVLLAAFKDSYIPLHAGELSTNFGEAKSVGKVLFNKYVFPFELTSILFLSAMVGAVILGKKHIDD
jgi:NADH-quinone oxidoreductase subunit J